MLILLTGMGLPPKINALMNDENVFRYATTTTTQLLGDYSTELHDANPKAQPASIIMQFFILFMRNFRSTIRNTVTIKFLHLRQNVYTECENKN